MALEILVYCDTNTFIANVKQCRIEGKVADALAELNRGYLFTEIDTKLLLKGFLIREGDRPNFVGVIRDKNEMHRAERGRFLRLTLMQYGSNSQPGDLRIFDTFWAKNLIYEKWVRTMLKHNLFMKYKDKELERLIVDEEARNIPAAPPVGAWSGGYIGATGMVPRTVMMGTRGEESEFVPPEPGGAIGS